MSSWRPQGGPAARRKAFRPSVLPLEDRAVPSTTTATDPATTTTPPTTPTPTPPAVKQVYAIGADAGSAPKVNVYAPDGTTLFSITAYDARFRGGVRVAVGDVTGDGVADIVTAPGAGMTSQIKVFDGTSGAEVANFMAYRENFRGGVFVAVADVNDDGHGDIITGAGEGGGPHVKVIDGTWAVPPINALPMPTQTTPVLQDPPEPALTTVEPGLINEFYAYDPMFTGGVRVAAGDINGDGKADIVTGAGINGGPHIKEINGATGQLIREFYAYSPTYAGGVFVSAGDFDGDGKAELAVSTGGRTTPQVHLYDDNGTLLRSYLIGGQFSVVPTRVAMADIDADGKQDLITTMGNQVQFRNPLNNAIKKTVTATFDPTVATGVFVG